MPDSGQKKWSMNTPIVIQIISDTLGKLGRPISLCMSLFHAYSCQPINAGITGRFYTGLLTEEQCKSKRQRKMMKKQQQIDQSPQQSEEESIPLLTDEQREVIENLVSIHKELEIPGPEDLKRVTVRECPRGGQSHLYTEFGQSGSSWTQYGWLLLCWASIKQKNIRHVVAQWNQVGQTLCIDGSGRGNFDWLAVSIACWERWWRHPKLRPSTGHIHGTLKLFPPIEIACGREPFGTVWIDLHCIKACMCHNYSS